MIGIYISCKAKDPELKGINGKWFYLENYKDTMQLMFDMGDNRKLIGYDYYEDIMITGFEDFPACLYSPEFINNGYEEFDRVKLEAVIKAISQGFTDNMEGFSNMIMDREGLVSADRFYEYIEIWKDNISEIPKPKSEVE